MINSVSLTNFGPIQRLKWDNLARINVILGQNGSGKTFLLKAIYASLRTLETYQRGDERRSASEILADKLYWTFQPDSIGDLVSKGSNGSLEFSMVKDSRKFKFSFGKDTTRQISSLENHIPSPRESNSIFLPAKEVLSLHNIILASRDTERLFGFDDTYVDLARSLRQEPTKGKNYQEFSKARKNLENILLGKVEYDSASTKWVFKNAKNHKFPINLAAEGIKKIAILDRLLINRYLDTGSIILIDEPESALHPAAINQLLEIIKLLADSGIQIFLATHSYFVMKKLYLISLEHQLSIPVLSYEAETWALSDLLDGMPENSIINESIRLYEQEVGLAMS